MTTTEFSEEDLHAALRQWPDSRALLEQSPSTDALLHRLQQCLRDLLEQRAGATFLDLLVLLRHWLLARAQGGQASWMEVPLTESWPPAHHWHNHGFEVADMGRTAQIRPRLPRLEWLGEQRDLFDDAFGGLQARVSTRIRADPPLLSLLGLPDYTGPGQREAIRALIHSPPGATLIANLPTGSGKSLLAQLPPMLAPQGALTLVIVPTVALAIDQGRRMSALFRERDPEWSERPLSFHGGLTVEERAAVFQALRTGGQRVLFTSPEAATGSLRSLLLDCARDGRLSHVVIDEAHLVVTWGSGFRPAFQLLPALISALRRVRGDSTRQSLRVALASATLTAHTITTLRTLFSGHAGDCVISGIFLRPEPRYAMKRMASLADRRQCVVEAVMKAPRPLILYVTRPIEAEEWLEILREQGFGRIASFTGETPPVRRQALMTAWNQNALDGMVATSAFGLGVDKDDVRTVIHATLPESLDRFYQEVGRSGRDGKASASLLLYTDADVGQARDMSGPTLIGNDLGFERWESMLADTSLGHGPDGEIWIDLNRLRPGLKVQGKSNLGWNLRTLNLMASAGLIELTALSAQPPSSDAAAAASAAVDVEYNDAQVAYACVRIRDPNHRTRVIFETRMNAVRDALLAAADRGLDLMHRTASAQLEISDALVKLYGLALPDHWADVTKYCGGCARHWGSGRMPARDLRPSVARPSRFSDRTRVWPALLKLPRQSQRLVFVIVADPTLALTEASSCLAMMLQATHPHTLLLSRSTNPASLDSLRKRLSDTRSDTFIDLYDADDPGSFAAGEGELRFIVWQDAVMSRRALGSLASSPSAMTIVFIQASLPDPERPDRRLASVVAHADESAVLRSLIQ
jgi:ATP-dependent DNA helicase RecQ